MTAFDKLPSIGYGDATEHALGERNSAHGSHEDAPMVRILSENGAQCGLLVRAPELIIDIINDPATFSSTGHPQAQRFDSDATPEAAEIYAAAGSSLKNIAAWSDGFDHRRVRKLIQFAFSPAQVARKTDNIHRLTQKLLSSFKVGTSLDFIPAYAHRLPTMVITHEFGLDLDEVPLVREVTDNVSAMMDTSLPYEFITSAAPSIVALHERLNTRIEAGNLRENSLLHNIVHAQADGETVLAREEVLWLATLLLAAGGHTTGAMLGWCAYMLAARQDIQAEVRADPSNIELFVEETLRIHNPVSAHFRRATREARLGGVIVPAGTFITLRFDALNLDPSKYDEPRSFDMLRPDVKRHMTFGTGPHFCIGNLLARRELVITVSGLVENFQKIELDPAQSPKQLHSFDFHVLESLPLILH